MDKKDLVKRFYEKGILPSPKELDTNARKEEPPINTNGKSPKKISPQDIIDYNNRKYEKIKVILLKKMDAVSITNAKTDPSPCGIIGIVKNLTQAGFVFEDPTGEMEVVKSGIAELEKIRPDDIFGLKGFVRENRFFPKELIWPDIPLNHRIGRIGGMTLTLSNKSNPEIIISENQKEEKIRIGGNPEWIRIARGHDRVVILAFKTSGTTRDAAAFYLKKRSLPEPGPVTPSEHCLIEEIPDILWLIQKDEWFENHKGVTIISSNHAELDTETRAVKFG